MDKPIARSFRPPPDVGLDPVDWFEVSVGIIRQIGARVESTESKDGVLTVRTAPSTMFIPVVVRAYRAGGDLRVLWEYSDTPRVGWRQRFLYGWADDFNRFIQVMKFQYHAGVRAITPAEWAAENPSRNPLSK
jgi:hypothetical protein